MGLEFDVVPEQVRAAATAVRAAVDPVAGWSSPSLSASAYGHPGLAAAAARTGQAAAAAVAAARAQGEDHARGLDATASAYELQDDLVATTFARSSPAGGGG